MSKQYNVDAGLYKFWTHLYGVIFKQMLLFNNGTIFLGVGQRFALFALSQSIHCPWVNQFKDKADFFLTTWNFLVFRSSHRVNGSTFFQYLLGGFAYFYSKNDFIFAILVTAHFKGKQD